MQLPWFKEHVVRVSFGAMFTTTFLVGFCDSLIVYLSVAPPSITCVCTKGYKSAPHHSLWPLEQGALRLIWCMVEKHGGPPITCVVSSLSVTITSGLSPS